MSKLRLMFAVAGLLVLVVSSSQREICRRMYFQHGKEELMPYVQLEGVYAKYEDNNSHPTFKHEERNYVFEYHKEFNLMYFSRIDNGTRDYMGLLADMSTGFKQSNWIDHTTYPDIPFYSFTKKWRYYDGTKFHTSVDRKGMYFKCVDADFYKCSSERLFFNTTLTSNGRRIILHNHTTDYFSVLPDIYVNNRQVYKHSKQLNWYLFYQSSYWTVGPDYTTASGYLKVYDSPISPEYISHNWEYWNGTFWKYFESPVGLKCRGITQRNANGTVQSCLDRNPCLNNASCVDNSLTNETVCLCPEKFKGANCSQPVKSCSRFSAGSSVLYSYLYGSQVNDIATVFCNINYIPKFRFQQCRNIGSLTSWTSGSCRKKPTAKPWSSWSSWSRPTAKPWSSWSSWSRSTAKPWSSWSSWSRPRYREEKKSFNFDNYVWARPVFLGVVIVLQLTVPFVHMLIGIWHDKSASRIISIHAYISFVCWLTYYSACSYTKCANHGQLFGDFGIMAIVMIVLCYLYILMESCFATESQYISNILKDKSAMDYITALINSVPQREMMIECWHMETKTRTVYYTDAQGNSQTRTETYQERVVTYTEEEMFPIGYSRDLSDRAGPKFDKYGVTRLKLSQDISCGDLETIEKFNDSRERMLENNKNMDENVDFSYEDKIPGFKKRICAYTDVRYKPWWMNLSCFWLATLLGLSWPFRLFFRWKTTKAEYMLKKEIFVRPPENESFPSTTPFQTPQQLPSVRYDGTAVINMAYPAEQVSYHGQAPYPEQPPYPMPYPPLANSYANQSAPGNENIGFVSHCFPNSVNVQPLGPPNEQPPDYYSAVSGSANPM